MTRLNVHRVAFGLTSGVLGATANRMGVWTQGCSLRHCPGCCSRPTWPTQGGVSMEVRALLDLARAQPRPPSGLTLSGGEPTDQAEALAALIKAFCEEFSGAEVVLFTGHRWPVFASRFLRLAGLCDVVVAGPFVRTLPATPLAGSTNQEVRLLTPLAQRLYRDWRRWPLHATQVSSVASGELVTVGIPDTRRLDQAVGEFKPLARSWAESCGGHDE